MNDKKAKDILKSIEYAIKTGILTDDDLDEMLDIVMDRQEEVENLDEIDMDTLF